jgi:hypothetical protein
LILLEYLRVSFSFTSFTLALVYLLFYGYPGVLSPVFYVDAGGLAGVVFFVMAIIGRVVTLVSICRWWVAVYVDCVLFVVCIWPFLVVNVITG